MPVLQMNNLTKTPEPAFQMFGIYAIQNNVNQRVYIGRTAKSFIRRWRQHRADLHTGYHSRPELQADWKSGGDSIFTCAILETAMAPADLEAREEWYMLATAREIGIKQLYNSFFQLRNIRNEFHIVSRSSKRGGMIQKYLD